MIDEGMSYSQAGIRFERKVPFYFVTNEFCPARLDKLIGANVLNAVVHVNPNLLTDQCGLNDRLRQLKGLPKLCTLSRQW